MMKNFLKKFIISLFCPVWFLFNHNGSSKFINKNWYIIKYVFAVLFTAAVVVFVYYLNKEIL